MLEPLLMTCAQVTTWRDDSLLTNASGFFFENEGSLYLITSRHVVMDEPSGHTPDKIGVEIHTNRDNLAESVRYFIPLHEDKYRYWKQGSDRTGEVDVAAIEVYRDQLPDGALFYAFTPNHLPDSIEQISIGTRLLIVGFPLGFHDTLHHLPVARQAINASSFGMRFQGEGYFLTDARTHRGMSGAPVVMPAPTRREKRGDIPWVLLGIHSARLDVGTREMDVDEALGLNCAWFADFLMTLTSN
jgi:hypothetical protein